jgi:hypothetical protein
MPEVSSDQIDIEVVGHEEDSLTGRVTIHVQSVRRLSENSTIRGPIKSYGIDPDTLTTAHEGDIDQWLEWVKCRHQKFCGVNLGMTQKIASLKGKKL